jgi:glycosyltransferase involved in cell wall biosynthesis
MIIGETGRVVPAQEPQQFAEALLEILQLPVVNRRQLGAAARRRIVNNFELTHATGMFLDLWRELAGRNLAKTVTKRAA